MKLRTSAAVLLFASLAFVPVVVASPQSNNSSAHLTGVLTDPSGASISGADIKIQSTVEPNRSTISAKSAADGSYSVSLPAGGYRVQFIRQPFTSREFDVDLSTGESRTLNVRLELERLSSSVI